MIDVTALILTGVVAAVASFFGSFVMWKVIGPRVVSKGVGTSLGPAMLNWLFEPSVKTGEKIKVKHEKQDGTIVDKEVDEVLAPAEILALKMGNVIYRMTLSKMGVDGHKRAMVLGDIQAELANPDSPFSQFAGFLSPKARERALKDGDYVPILLDLLVSSPQAQSMLGKVLNKLKAQSTPGAASTGLAGVSGKTW